MPIRTLLVDGYNFIGAVSTLRPDRLEASRERAGIDPGRITVELTETHPVSWPEILRPVLHRLRDAGYRLSIDDVGPAMPDYEALFGLPLPA